MRCCHIDSVGSAQSEVRRQLHRQFGQPSIDRDQPKCPQPKQMRKRGVCQSWFPRSARDGPGDFREQQRGVSDNAAARDVLLEPRPARGVVNVLWHQPGDPDACVYHCHNSRRPSRTASAAEVSAGQLAPICAARSSRSVQAAAVSSGRGRMAPTGTRRAMARPRMVTSTGSPFCCISRRTRLACALSSRTPIDRIPVLRCDHPGDHIVLPESHTTAFS